LSTIAEIRSGIKRENWNPRNSVRTAETIEEPNPGVALLKTIVERGKAAEEASLERKNSRGRLEMHKSRMKSGDMQRVNVIMGVLRGPGGEVKEVYTLDGYTRCAALLELRKEGFNWNGRIGIEVMISDKYDDLARLASQFDSQESTRTFKEILGYAIGRDAGRDEIPLGVLNSVYKAWRFCTLESTDFDTLFPVFGGGGIYTFESMLKFRDTEWEMARWFAENLPNTSNHKVGGVSVSKLLPLGAYTAVIHSYKCWGEDVQKVWKSYLEGGPTPEFLESKDYNHVPLRDMRNMMLLDASSSLRAQLFGGSGGAKTMYFDYNLATWAYLGASNIYPCKFRQDKRYHLAHGCVGSSGAHPVGSGRKKIALRDAIYAAFQDTDGKGLTIDEVTERVVKDARYDTPENPRDRVGNMLSIVSREQPPFLERVGASGTGCYRLVKRSKQNGHG